MNNAALQAMGKESENANMGEFSEDFQLAIIRQYIKDLKFFQKVRDAFDPEYFTELYLQALATLARQFVDEFRRIPTIADLRELTTSTTAMDAIIKDNVLQALNRMNHLELSNELVEALAIPFFRKMEMLKALMKSVELVVKDYTTQETDYEEIFNTIKKAHNSCSSEGHFHDYVKDVQFRYPPKEEGEFVSMASTGLFELDALTQGGIDKGELGIITAGTGGGKSHFLVHVGCSALEQKKKVWHITLELGKEYVGRRYDSRLLGIPVHTLDVNHHNVLKQVREMQDTYLKIVEYPANKLTTSKLASDYEKLALMDFIPDVLVIDYPDLMLPYSGKMKSFSDQSMYNALGMIYASLRDFGKEYGLPIWGASQINRKGVEDGGQTETLADMADSMKKTFYADLIVSLMRTKDNDLQKKARLYIKKNRRGPDNVGIPLHNVDLSTSYFEVDSHDFDLNVAPNIMEFVQNNKTERIVNLAEAMKRQNHIVVNFAEDIIRARNSIREYNQANSISIRGTVLNGDVNPLNGAE